MNWDECIEREEIYLNFYSTSMIYFQNRDIVKKKREIKYNNIFLDIDVDEIEDDLEIIPD